MNKIDVYVRLIDLILKKKIKNNSLQLNERLIFS